MNTAKILCGLLILPWLHGCSNSDTELVRACETALKDQLQPPSDYKRVEIRQLPDKPMTRSDYANYLFATERVENVRDSKIRMFEQGKLKPTTFYLAIKYDAPNSNGVITRDIAVCSYLDFDGVASNAKDYSVSINGRISAEARIKALTE